VRAVHREEREASQKNRQSERRLREDSKRKRLRRMHGQNADHSATSKRGAEARSMHSEREGSLGSAAAKRGVEKDVEKKNRSKKKREKDSWRLDS